MDNIPVVKYGALRDEWDRLVRLGIIPREVRNPILRSWLRCKKLGVDPEDISAKVLSMDELNRCLTTNSLLIEIVKKSLSDVSWAVSNSGYLWFLTDKDVNLLYINGDKRLAQRFEELDNFKVGVNWGEQTVGTTAASIAVEINDSVFWISEEKYCMRLKEKACAAVPIRGKNGRVVGVLGVATDQDGLIRSARPVYDSLVLVSMAVQSLYQQFEMEMFFEREKNSLKLVLGEITEGVVITDKNGIIVEVNNRFGDLSGLDVSDVVGKHIKAAFPQAAFAFDRDSTSFINNKKDNSRKSQTGIKNMQVKSLEFECARGAQEYCVHIFNKGPELIKDAAVSSEGSLFKADFVFDDIIGESREIMKVKNLALNIAREDYEVLIEGRTGTGKEMFAQAIHNASSRANGPLVSINCGAIPAELIESELFGYEGGAFTGARPAGAAGKFELANGGTLFFDEIGEMPLNLQSKLLRVLQEKKFMKVGGRCPITVDVRIISATNRNIEAMVKEGLFREDLFWRLNVLRIRIPTLLERQPDIPILIEHFLGQHSTERGMNYKLSSSAYDIMQKYHWPGNVRELQNSLKRAVVFTDNNIILPGHLPEHVLRHEGLQLDRDIEMPLHDAERRIIIEAINSNNGNLSKSARVLGISRATLYNKIKKYHITC